MSIFRRLTGGTRGGRQRDLTLEQRWERYAADYQPIVDALGMESPNREFDRLVDEGRRLEDEYQRRSRGGRLDIDPADRLRGVSYVSGVADARLLRDLSEDDLKAKLAHFAGLVREQAKPIEHPLVMAYFLLAELQRRSGGQGLQVPTSLEEATATVRDLTGSGHTIPATRTDPTADMTDSAAADRLTQSLRDGARAEMDRVRAGPFTERDWIQEFAAFHGMGEEEMLAALLSDAPEGTFYSLRSTAPGPEALMTWRSRIDAFPETTLASMAHTQARLAGSGPTAAMIRRRMQRLMDEAERAGE